MEPIRLKNFIHQRVSNLREAVSNMYNGDALCYSFRSPNSFFVGTIPYAAQAIWHTPNEVTLHIASGGCTFFLWSHLVENLVITCLVIHKFVIFALDIDVTFHIFDAIKFCTSLKVDELHDMMEEELAKMFRAHQHDDFVSDEFLQYSAKSFFAMNQVFQKLGVGITQIHPSIHLNIVDE